MPSQLNVVFLVPTKRDWLSLIGKKEEDGELVDAPASEVNIKLPVSWIRGNGITESFLGWFLLRMIKIIYARVTKKSN